MSVPVKYRELGDFHEYYSGARQAPYLTIFVGGNHEASHYLSELFYGGWVAPNIYYLGAANVVRYGGLRIASLSGIWKGFDYRKPHHERLPYNESDVKSAYHVREIDVRKLLQTRSQVDIGISHDWPKGVEWEGDSAWLFRRKNGFEDDARTGRLGSVAARNALDRLRPRFWFSAHLHVKYAATIEHSVADAHSDRQGTTPSGNGQLDKPNELQESVIENEEEIELDMDDTNLTPDENVSVQVTNDDEVDPGLEDASKVTAFVGDFKESNGVQQDVKATEQSSEEGVSSNLRAQLPASFFKPAAPVSLPFPADITNNKTEFLALDKCMPHRDFLQLLEIRPAISGSTLTDHNRLEYDPEWLAITRALHFAHDNKPYHSFGDPNAQCPPDLGEATYLPLIETQQQWIQANIVDSKRLAVPTNFQRTAPVWDSTTDGDWRKVRDQPREYANPQTQAFCDLLDIPNAFTISNEEAIAAQQRGPAPSDNAFSGGRGGRGNWRGHGHHGRGRGRGMNRGSGRGQRRGGRW